MYLNHTIDHPLGAYRGTYKMEIILIFHGEIITTRKTGGLLCPYKGLSLVVAL